MIHRKMDLRLVGRINNHVYLILFNLHWREKGDGGIAFSYIDNASPAGPAGRQWRHYILSRLRLRCARGGLDLCNFSCISAGANLRDRAPERCGGLGIRRRVNLTSDCQSALSEAAQWWRLGDFARRRGRRGEGGARSWGCPFKPGAARTFKVDD